MLSNSTVPLVGIVDTAVMGRMGAPEWIAATAVGAILFSSIFWVFGFLRMGTGGLVAQAYGAARATDAGRIAVRALLIAIVLGLFLIVFQRPILDVGLLALDNDNDWQELTRLYFTIRIVSAPATLMLYAITGTLVGLQRMNQVLVLQLLLNILNVVLNVLLFTQTDLGIAGVAWATVVSEFVTLALGLYCIRDTLTRALRQGPIKHWLFNAAALTRFFRISGDLFIRTLCLTLAFYYMTVLGSRISVATLAVNTVLLHLVHFASHCMDGYAHAIESLTGFAVGKRSPTLFSRAVRAASELGVVTALLFSIVFWLAGDSLIALMTTDPAIQQMARNWLPWVILAPIVGIWSFLLDGIFIGATETASMRNSMIVSLMLYGLCTLIAVPALHNHGIWLSYYVLMIARTLTLARYWSSLTARMSGRQTV